LKDSDLVDLVTSDTKTGEIGPEKDDYTALVRAAVARRSG
jgi:hypothetical protein